MVVAALLLPLNVAAAAFVPGAATPRRFAITEESPLIQ